MHSGPFGRLTKPGAKRAELVQKFVPRSRVGIFRSEHNRSNPLDPKLTFWCISYNLCAVEAKRAELVQKFVPRIRVALFATNAPYPPHWTINYRFGAFHTICVHSGLFGCLPKLGARQAELVQKFVPRSRFGIFRNERTRSPPLDPKLMFCCITYYLGAFGTVWLPYDTRCKTGRTSAKVRATILRQIFFATNAPDPPHWTLN